MAKSMVEKYEQILSADPGSMVFVELAKALLDRGEQQKAIKICEEGVQHHPESVVGRVLWGKALISAGKPADAMSQFDEAIAIDRENPYAYNLIGEVLLHKGLHRSAIPILKKALALQPNDNRVRQWLDQATRAVNGEAEPVKAQFTTIDPPPPEQITVTNVQRYIPEAARGEAPPPAPPPAPAALDPFQQAALSSPNDSEILRGMTDIFQALGHAEPPPAPASAPLSPPRRPSVEIAAPLLSEAEPPPPVADAADAPGPLAVDSPGPEPRAVGSFDEGLPEAPEKPPPPVAEEEIPREAQAAAEPEPALAPEPEPADRSAHEAETREMPPLGSHEVMTTLDASAPSSSEGATALEVSISPPRNLASEAPTLELAPGEVAQLAKLSASAAGENAGSDALEPGAPRKPITQPFGTASEVTEAATTAQAPLPEAAAATEVGPHDLRTQPAGAPPGVDRSLLMTDPGPPPPGPVPVPTSGPTPVPGQAAAVASKPPPLHPPSRPRISSPAVPIPPRLPPRPKVAGLADIPDMPGAGLSPSMELPKVDISPQAAEAIAKEYERELRERLAATARPETFWSKNGLWIGAAAVVVLLGVVATQVFSRTKKASINVADTEAKARVGLEKDTRASYQAALDALADLLSVSTTDANAALAQAMSAYSRALLYREHGGDENDRKKAFAALDALGALPDAAKQASLVAAARFYLADGEAEQRQAGKVVLDLPAPGAEAHEIGGRLLMHTDQKRAMDQLKASLAADKAFVRAYVDLGEIYLERGELPHAKENFEAAKLISEKHPAVLLGLARARIGLGVELDQAAADLAAMEKDTGDLDESGQANLQLVSARLMAEQGHAKEALEKLSSASGRFKSNAVDFALGMAEIQELQGNYDQALAALVPVSRANPRDPVLAEAVAHAQLAMGHPKDALATTDPMADDRRLRLERALARQQMGDLEGARRELLSTRKDNKNVSVDVAIALARLDLASGRKDEARSALTAISSTGHVPPRAHLALGELALADGNDEVALKELTEAAADPHDAEAPLELGKALLARGRLPEALTPLTEAVARNRFFTPALLPLGQAELGLGNVESARQHLSAYLKEHRDDAATLMSLARADILAGDVADARRQADAAVIHAPRDPAAVWTRIQISLAAGDGSKALRELERRAKSGRTGDEWCDLADALLELGDSKDAAGAYAKAARVDRQSLRAQVGQWVAAASHGDRGALKELESHAGPPPKLPPPLLARALAALARAPDEPPDKAKGLAEAAVKAWGASGEAHLALGEQLSGADRTHELVQAKSLDPARPEARVALAESLFASGDRAQAFAEASAALRIVPSGPLADRARAVINGGDSSKRRPTR